MSLLANNPESVSPAGISEPAKTLLVVDDESLIRQLHSEVLRLQGYTVLEAESAMEALRVAGEAEVIHLLITDFSMPEVDGLELSRRFRAVHPAIPVLMVSGSVSLLHDRSEELSLVELLAKPFEFSELLHRVRTLLDAATPLPMRKRSSSD
jgi:DNA-binding response OmpR family regulator